MVAASIVQGVFKGSGYEFCRLLLERAKRVAGSGRYDVAFHRIALEHGGVARPDSGLIIDTPVEKWCGWNIQKLNSIWTVNIGSIAIGLFLLWLSRRAPTLPEPEKSARSQMRAGPR